MEGIIPRIFGKAVSEEEYQVPAGTPNYIRFGYTIKKLIMGRKECLLVSPKNPDWNLGVIKKQIKTIGQITGENTVAGLDRLTASQRTNLIESGIAFVSGTGQVFIPFWGSYFEERIANAPEQAEKMSANAQLVFLYLFYNRAEASGFTQTAISRKLNMPKATCTRAVRLLSGLNLITTVNDGTAKRVFLNGEKDSILREAMPYMTSPVYKILYVTELPDGIRMKRSGIRAVAEHSMLQALPADGAFAVDRETAKEIRGDLLLDKHSFRDFGGQTVEVWKYDPFLLSETESVDDLSLLLDLAGENDERVQSELDRIRGKYDLEGNE